MGHKIMRVSLDFSFPIGKSYSRWSFDRHCDTCDAESHRGCAYQLRPPTGDGWQLWETVSDAPLSPVFESADMLIGWMSKPVPLRDRKPWRPEAYPPNPWAQGWSPAAAAALVDGEGWMPSGIIEGGRVLSADEILGVSDAG